MEARHEAASFARVSVRKLGRSVSSARVPSSTSTDVSDECMRLGSDPFEMMRLAKEMTPCICVAARLEDAAYRSTLPLS